jgi:hypothetical protein
MTKALIEKAAHILQINDLGTYTVPTHGLYPFQWNWDSCLTALGQSHLNEDRAWTEIETLFDHQWDDGMVPHIVFHKEDDGYFPGPGVWGTNRNIPTSGITQPAVAGFAIKNLYDRSQNKTAASRRALALLPKVFKWHQWFYTNRDPQKTGLVAIIHPWESGRDNSVDWDDAFLRVPTDGVAPFVRRDTQHANPAHRPTQEQYERYIWLVQTFRALNWDNSKLHDASPFQIVDPGFNGILLRSVAEIAALATELGSHEIAQASALQLDHGIKALETLWNAELGQYTCYDRVAGCLIDSPSIAGLLAAFAPIPVARAEMIAATVEKQAQNCRYLVASHDPLDDKFDAKRYWRGPVWLIVNYMIANGLHAAGQSTIATRIDNDCLSLIENNGFAEYYDPHTGEPCGGDQFTWTAAMVIEIIKSAKVAA